MRQMRVSDCCQAEAQEADIHKKRYCPFRNNISKLLLEQQLTQPCCSMKYCHMLHMQCCRNKSLSNRKIRSTQSSQQLQQPSQNYCSMHMKQLQT